MNKKPNAKRDREIFSKINVGTNLFELSFKLGRIRQIALNNGVSIFRQGGYVKKLEPYDDLSHQRRVACREKRHLLIERLRSEGKTHAQIGSDLGIGSQRVGQILQLLRARRQRALKTINCNEPWTELPVRAVNCLRAALQDLDLEYPTPDKILGLIENGLDLKKIHNLGKISLREIEAWLLRHGGQKERRDA